MGYLTLFEVSKFRDRYEFPLSPCTRGERAGVRGDSIPRENVKLLHGRRPLTPGPSPPEYSERGGKHETRHKGNGS
jgi:hypothetical protein